MGKLKRAITILIMMLLMIGIFIGRVNAASASISVSARKVTVGQNVSVTVSFSEKVSAAQFKLSYDSSKFKFISSSEILEKELKSLLIIVQMEKHQS